MNSDYNYYFLPIKKTEHLSEYAALRYHRTTFYV